MDRKGLLIGFLAGGWLATVLILVVPHLGLVPVQAADEDGPTIVVNPGIPGAPGYGQRSRGIPNPGGGTADSNNRSVALSASAGGGQSVVYYFDTVAQRLCVYQYDGTSKGGLRLLAARSIEWDLKLETYRDVSEKSPREMREAYERSVQGSPKKKGGRVLPTKKVDLSGQGG